MIVGWLLIILCTSPRFRLVAPFLEWFPIWLSIDGYTAMKVLSLTVAAFPSIAPLHHRSITSQHHHHHKHETIYEWHVPIFALGHLFLRLSSSTLAVSAVIGFTFSTIFRYQTMCVSFSLESSRAGRHTARITIACGYGAHRNIKI